MTDHTGIPSAAQYEAWLERAFALARAGRVPAHPVQGAPFDRALHYPESVVREAEKESATT